MMSERLPPGPAPANPRLRALGMLLIANFYWGLSFPVIKAVVLTLGRLQPQAKGGYLTTMAVAPRFLLAFILLAWWPRRAVADRAAGAGGRLTRGEWKQGLIIGGFGAVGMMLQIDGLRFTAASTSAFLTQFYAILIPLYLAVRGRRRPTTTTVICCLLVLEGVALLGRFDWRAMHLGRGEWETLLSSVFFMGQILCLGNRAYDGNRPRAITLVMFGAEAAVFTVATLAAAPSAHSLAVPWSDGPWVGLTLILTIFCTMGSFSLMNAWQPKITPTEAGLIYCVEPIFGSLLALCLPALFSHWAGIDYPNETATSNLLLGGGLITLANILIQLRPPPAPSA
jgi:drug/metabolite transporter (DMT)-like permease